MVPEYKIRSAARDYRIHAHTARDRDNSCIGLAYGKHLTFVTPTAASCAPGGRLYSLLVDSLDAFPTSISYPLLP